MPLVLVPVPLFLAPTGALEEGMLYVRLSVRDIIQKSIENEH